MKIRRWQLLEGNKTLNFHRISDFDLDSFQETTNGQPKNLPFPTQSENNNNTSTPERNEELIMALGVILTILGLILALFWFKKKGKSKKNYI